MSTPETHDNLKPPLADAIGSASCALGDACPYLVELLAARQALNWAQATLNVLNVGNIKSGSLMHLKLREVMIAYRAARNEAPNEQGQAGRDNPNV